MCHVKKLTKITLLSLSMGFFSFSLATSSKFENLAMKVKVGFQLSFQLVFQ